jgi:hypothetical protein
VLRKIHWLTENFEQLTPQALTGDLRDLHQNKVPAVLGFGFAQPAKAEG